MLLVSADPGAFARSHSPKAQMIQRVNELHSGEAAKIAAHTSGFLAIATRRTAEHNIDRQPHVADCIRNEARLLVL